MPTFAGTEISEEKHGTVKTRRRYMDRKIRAAHFGIGKWEASWRSMP